MAFIILKLTHVIDWSWWWVLSPFWIPLGIWLIVLAVSLPAIIKRRKRRKELEKWKFR
ncbi:MAG: transmembrane Fragile-X-F protein [Oscillospiraceae bacterium]|nr:transmembrane Fragile-X-F protein [Oscillospiraceae bacterium]